MFHRITFLIFLFLIYCTIELKAQKENNIWIFNDNIGIDFNNGRPKVFRTQSMQGYGDPSTVCNADGNLLFYTNAKQVLDRTHQLMPGGIIYHNNMYGFPKSMVVPFINDTNRYYLFTFNDSSYTISYSIVDMTLNNGKGGIKATEKNIYIDNAMSSCMIAIRGAGCYTWFLTHKYGSNEFKAYKITESGIEPSVSSFSGTFSNMYSYGWGNISISKNNKLLAIANAADDAIELYDFDNVTGHISNAELVDKFGSSGRAHSVAFSPDGTKLYLVGGPKGSGLHQYDLTQEPYRYATIVDTGSIGGQLRLGPDNKLYMSTWFGIYCIQYPDSTGLSCGFTDSYIKMEDGMNTLPYSLGIDIVKPIVSTAGQSIVSEICEGDSVTLSIPDGFTEYAWSDKYADRERVIKSDEYFMLSSYKPCYMQVDTFTIKTSNCNCKVWFPNAFTPNNDGINDNFKPIGGDFESVEMKIFDRWGKMVFNSQDISIAWDGTHNNRNCDIGTYYYYLWCRCMNGNTLERKGSVHIIR